jgi:hypothetical protein
MAPPNAADADGTVPTGVVLSDRGATLAEFEDYLHTVNNRDGCPYEDKTIVSYVGPGKNLDAWMTRTGIEWNTRTKCRPATSAGSGPADMITGLSPARTPTRPIAAHPNE